MQSYFGLIIFILFICTVLYRNFSLKRQGIEAVEFGKKDKKDFIILPFALFYLYLLLAHCISLPNINGEIIFHLPIISWLGVLICFLAYIFFIWTLISFKNSFRVGLVNNSKQGLITSGSFAISRNPIYVSFAVMLLGQFLISGSWLFLVYIVIGVLTFHQQILKEESFLKQQYGENFLQYCKKTRRYL